MAIRFGDAIQAFGQARQQKQQQQTASLDALVKMEKLKERGYDVESNPGFMGFGGGVRLKKIEGFQPATLPEGYKRFGEKVYRDPSYLSPAQKIGRFRTAQQFGVDPITGHKLSNNELYKPRYGYKDDLSQMFGGGSNANAPYASPAMAPPNAAQAPEELGKLNPRDHYNQLRSAGYTTEQARKMAGV